MELSDQNVILPKKLRVFSVGSFPQECQGWHKEEGRLPPYVGRRAVI